MRNTNMQRDMNRTNLDRLTLVDLLPHLYDIFATWSSAIYTGVYTAETVKERPLVWTEKT